MYHDASVTDPRYVLVRRTYILSYGAYVRIYVCAYVCMYIVLVHNTAKSLSTVTVSLRPSKLECYHDSYIYQVQVQVYYSESAEV